MDLSDAYVYAGWNPSGGQDPVTRRAQANGFCIILSNTYHLWLRPGDELMFVQVACTSSGELDQPILTDSGFQGLFSQLTNAIAEGVNLTTSMDLKMFLSLQCAISIQNNLGSDIMMSFDECLQPTSPRIMLRSLLSGLVAGQSVDSYPQPSTRPRLLGSSGAGFEDLRQSVCSRFWSAWIFRATSIEVWLLVSPTACECC